MSFGEIYTEEGDFQAQNKTLMFSTSPFGFPVDLQNQNHPGAKKLIEN